MKVGDLVKTKRAKSCPASAHFTPMLIIELVDKKCWRTHERGRAVRWDEIEPEPHAVVVVNGRKMTIPVASLEAIGEGR